MPAQKSNIIKVLGFGGGGGNAVSHMYTQNIQNVDFIVCNTDAQALALSPVPNKVQLGPHLTQGLGAGANPSIGKQATEESLDEIRNMMEVNTRMAFITAGMGGGTGTGGAPTVAKICKEMGILTVGIVTTPFMFEGPKRMAQAQRGIDELKQYVDTLLVISNDKLRHQYGNLKMKEAFSKADNVLSTAARCITDVINTTGAVNLDFADVCTVMRDGGVAILGSAQRSGENRALEAIEAAINSPLLNDNDIAGAKWLLLNITSSEGDHEFTMDEVADIQNYVREQTGENTDVILGMGYDESLGDNIGITIIATGFQHKDPFVIKEAAKNVVPEEAPIIMTLGVEGEEQKMEAPKTDEVKATADLMPVVEEVEEIKPIVLYNELPTTTYAPVKDEEQETPQVFELSVEPNKIQEPVLAPLNVNPDTWKYEEPKSEPVQNKTPDFRFNNPSEAVESHMAPVLKEHTSEDEEALSGMQLSIEETPAPAIQFGTTQTNVVTEAAEEPAKDLTEEELQKRRAQERIERLRRISFNPLEVDNSGEFEHVPAYMRRKMDFQNSAIANVEDYYSRAQVKTDGDNTEISTLNNFLHGNRPD